jgi:hypothetical protein
MSILVSIICVKKTDTSSEEREERKEREELNAPPFRFNV